MTVERRVVDGRGAAVCWLDADFEPTDEAGAEIAKVVFDDGDVTWAAPGSAAAQDEWNEADHPRGQPDNAGQFAKKGQGGAGGKREEKSRAETQPQEQPPKQAPGPLAASNENVKAAEAYLKPYAQEGSLTAFEHDYPASAELLKQLHGSLAVAAAAAKSGEGGKLKGAMLGSAFMPEVLRQKLIAQWGSGEDLWKVLSDLPGFLEKPGHQVAAGLGLALSLPEPSKQATVNFMTGFLGGGNVWSEEQSKSSLAQIAKELGGAPAAPKAKAAGAFAPKPLGEHKHFKASANVNEHQARVKSWAAAPALRNHTYRWQTNKLIDEAKAYIQQHPQVLAELSAGISQLKFKIGESFAREAGAAMTKGDPKGVAGAMAAKAAKMTGLSPAEMVAKGWLPTPAQQTEWMKKLEGGAQKATLQGPAPSTYEGMKTPIAHGEEKAKFAAQTGSSLESLIGSLDLAENSALKDKYGSIKTALEAFKLKAEQEAKAAAAAILPSEEIVAQGVTTAEIEKAKKTSPYYPPPQSKEGQALAQQWNAKYQGKTLTDQSQLAQKVLEYKQVAAQIAALEAKEQTAAKAAAAKAAAEAAAKQKAQAAAEAAEVAAAKAAKEAELKKIMSAIGVADPNDAAAFQGFVELAGGEHATQKLIADFKKFEDQGAHAGLPISPFEYAMIQSYTGSAFHGVNKALRGEAWSLKTHIFATAVNKALKKLPPWPGQANRGTDLTPSQQAKYATVGNVVQELAFMSTSKKEGWGGNTKWHVTGKSGRDISHISTHGGEAEVLFPARTFFKIDKVVGSPGGKMEVWMTEVDLF